VVVEAPTAAFVHDAIQRRWYDARKTSIAAALAAIWSFFSGDRRLAAVYRSPDAARTDNCRLTIATRTSMAITITVNGEAHSLDVEPEMPLLWALRESLGLTGTKFGCGISACGACTVHLDGRAVRSCVLPVSAADGKQVTTIEGLAPNGALHKVQQAWISHQVPQCGYCQSGVIMAVAGLLAQIPNPTDDEIDAGITNICRCGTFARMRAAIHAAAAGEGAAS